MDGILDLFVLMNNKGSLLQQSEKGRLPIVMVILQSNDLYS